MWKVLERGSSPVDWCEENYSSSAFVAEWVNTLSNVFFLVVAGLGMRLLLEHGGRRNYEIIGIWLALGLIGVFSGYFHATLSLFGQYLDELGILWLYSAAFAVFYPKTLYPEVLGGSRKRLGLACLAFACLGTGMCLLNPLLNAFALMLLCLPTFAVMGLRSMACGDARVKDLGKQVCLVWGLAFCCWCSDKFCCDFWRGIRFPYLHGFWHGLMALGCGNACVLFTYFRIRDETPQLGAVLRYWPKDSWAVGLPYVCVKDKVEGLKA